MAQAINVDGEAHKVVAVHSDGAETHHVLENGQVVVEKGR